MRIADHSASHRRLLFALAMPRILVADDNPLSLHFFADALIALGQDCAEAANGAIALELSRANAFDLLLLDARMPELDGTDVLARIRMQAGPSQRAIALATTADNDTAVHAQLLRAGFVEVLVKPIAIADLRDALARHLPNAASTGTTEATDDLDDRQALAAAGGDAVIVNALRGLFAAELDALPAELAALQRQPDAVRERLHRLDASAGFCGAPAIVRAANELRAALASPPWPQAAVDAFLAVCARTRARLTA